MSFRHEKISDMKKFSHEKLQIWKHLDVKKFQTLKTFIRENDLDMNQSWITFRREKNSDSHEKHLDMISAQ